MTPRRAVILVGVALTLSLWIGAWHGALSSDFGSGFFGTNGAAYSGRIASNLATHPLSLTRTGAPWFVLRAQEPLVLQYSNHPPGYMLLQGCLYGVCGIEPLVLKLFALLLHAGTALVLLLFFLPDRPAAAAVAGIFGATLPVAAHYGFMCSAFGPCTLLLAATLLLWRRHGRVGDAASLRWLCLLAGFNAWLDWNGLAMLPCLVVAALLQRRRALAAALGITLAASLGLLLAHCSYVLGGPSALLHEMQRLAGATGDGLRCGDAAWWLAMAGHLQSQFGAIALVLALGGWLLAPRELRSFALLSAAPGLLLIFALQHHAAVHDYWVQPLLPAVVWGAALACERALCLANKLVAVAAAATVAFVAVVGLMASSSSLAVSLAPDGARQIAQAVDSLATPDDTVLLPLANLENVGGYTTRQVMVGIDSVAEVDAITASIRARRPLGRVLLLLPTPWKDPAFAMAMEVRAPSKRIGSARLHVLLAPQ